MGRFSADFPARTSEVRKLCSTCGTLAPQQSRATLKDALERVRVSRGTQAERTQSLRIAVIPGDGVGPEVTAEAVNVLAAAAALAGRTLTFETFPWGADYYLKTGITIPPDGYTLLAQFDAILLGALGDARVPNHCHARDILLGTRTQLDLYVNYRPVRLLAERLCPLKDRTVADVDFVVIRENTEGLYAGIGGRLRAGTTDEIAIQEEVNTYKGVHRIIHYAFEHASRSGRARVCMADKSNAMQSGHALWQRVFREVSERFPSIEARHLYVDALALLLVQDPSQFDVIVTNNLFGDILTDLGAALQGGLGLAASANLHPGRTSMFEPVHGSAPPLAGRNVANPIGAILSAALLLEHNGWTREAAAVNEAVCRAVADRKVTADIGGTLGTSDAGGAIVAYLREAFESADQTQDA